MHNIEQISKNTLVSTKIKYEVTIYKGQMFVNDYTVRLPRDETIQSDEISFIAYV